MLRLLSKSEPAAPRGLPYSRHWIDEDDIRAVTAVLRSDWLTTGPAVESFENDVAAYTGARHAVAVSSGTAALHAAMHVLNIGPGDEVIVPAITFAATANAVLFQGGTPVFADVEPGTLCISPASAAERVTPRTRAIVSVDYAGQPCDYASLRGIANRHGLALVTDACHALGAEYGTRKVGTCGDLTVFSFHPVKHIATGEGGMAVTDDARFAARMRMFRNHGITTGPRQRETWFYEMADLGYNYRLSDFQAALGRSQLRKLPARLERRWQIAKLYARAFARDTRIAPLSLRPETTHAWHLYVVRLGCLGGADGRMRVYQRMREAGIGVNVHYIPVHLHPFYRRTLGTGPGLCPEAEAAYEQILSLPMFPQMSDADVDYVVEALRDSLSASAR